MYFFCLVSYTGSVYYGVNKQQGYTTVSSVLEHCLQCVLKNNVRVYFISRTDKDVSAVNQYFYFHYVFNNYDEQIHYLNKLSIKIRNYSKHSIIMHGYYVRNSLHMRHCYKEYIYRLSDKHNAALMNTHYTHNLNEQEMYAFIKILNFLNNVQFNYSVFCKKLHLNNRPVLQVLNIRYQFYTLYYGIQCMYIYISGECFLYRQIRMLIGTIINVCKKHNLQNYNNPESIMYKNNILLHYRYAAPAYALLLNKVILNDSQFVQT